MGNGTKTGGSLLTTLLWVLFVALKLTGIINWSWWWVFSPFWIPWAILVVRSGDSILAAALKRQGEHKRG